MLRIVAHQSAAAARHYYTQGLRREDYYTEGQEIIGKWHGLAAERLGLSGEVTQEAFVSLLENRHPVSGERLTPRNKADRRVGMDINFNAPKSLSLLEAVTGDKELIRIFRDAVSETMDELEKVTAVRVRKGGANGQRQTGNLVWAEFVHKTARPVGGLPDPHLHVHAFTMNTSFDEVEGRWKAAEFHDIKQHAPFYQAVFHSKLAGKIETLGYQIERTAGGWEIAGIPRSLCERFSRRTAQIDRLADAKNIHDAKGRDALGAASRESKRHGISESDLKASWLARMDESEKAAIEKVHRSKGAKSEKQEMPAGEAVDYAVAKLFEKNSVVQRDQILSEALKYGVGRVGWEKITAEFASREMLSRTVAGVTHCTTREILSEEVALIGFVRSGKGQFSPFIPGKGAIESSGLSAEQTRAVQHLLRSRDQVMAIKGGAGVGKTTLMREAVRQIEESGPRVFAFAPSAVASRETLRGEGFASADTVAHLFANKALQAQIRGQVIWIDEAGLLGVRDLWKIMQIAGETTRVILTGDTAQHAPVGRGDAFRQLQKYAGMKIAEVKEIRRQEKEDYKAAVSALSKADLKTAFRKLDDLGAIIEIADEAERYRMLAADYLEFSKGAKPPLVVSPTHAESAKVTAAIREAKREAGSLGADTDFRQLHNLRWSEADRKRAENYHEGLVLQLNQNIPGFLRGSQLRVTGHGENGEVMVSGPDGRAKKLPLQQPERFDVFEEREIPISNGDRIRITRNGTTDDGRRVNNGNEFTISKIDSKGRIHLETGGILKPDHGHIAHGYCQTSHSSQSKTERKVLIAESSDSFVAASREQFYVSVSRGKETVLIYTDSRPGLEKAVGYSSSRMAGLELAGVTKKDIASYMSSELTGKQWSEMIRSRTEPAGTRTFIDNLIKSRQRGGVSEDGASQWRQYVAARKSVVTVDGRHRSKGQPSTPGKRQGNDQNKARSFLRPNQHTKEVRESLLKQGKEVAEAKEKASPKKAPREKPAAKKVASKEERLAAAYAASAGHFEKILGRQKEPENTPQKQETKPLGKGAVKRAAIQGEKRKKAMAMPEVKPAKQKAPIVQPTIRK